MTPDIVRGLDSAIGDVIGRHDGGLVTRWVVLAEVATADGEKALYTLAPEDAKAWETVGMLTYALQVEQAATTAGYSED